MITRKLIVLISAVVFSSCKTDPLDQSWVPDSPAVSPEAYTCLEKVQLYTRGHVGAKSWTSKNFKVTYHYSVTAIPDKPHPEFVLQDEFGNTFTLFKAEGFSCPKTNQGQYCLKFTLPIDGQPLQNLRLGWNQTKLEVLGSDIPKTVKTAQKIPKLYDRDFVLEDLKRRKSRFRKDIELNLVPPNVQRKAQVDQAHCGNGLW